MSLPFKITTIGNKDTANVFKATFSEALALPPKIEAWDNAETFPERTSYGATTIKQIFAGTTGNESLPMLYAAATTGSSPGSDWKPTSVTAGGATINRLKGSTNYVLDPTTPDAGESITFNIGLEVPYDAVETAGEMEHTIQLRYFYSGDTPTVTLHGNSGTEGTPVWEEITTDTTGIRFCDVTIEGDYHLTLSQAGTVDAQNAWITYKGTEEDIAVGDANLKIETSETATGNTNLKKESVSESMTADTQLYKDIVFTSDTSLKSVESDYYHGDARLEE